MDHSGRDFQKLCSTNLKATSAGHKQTTDPGVILAVSVNY